MDHIYEKIVFLGGLGVRGVDTTQRHSGRKKRRGGGGGVNDTHGMV